MAAGAVLAVGGAALWALASHSGPEGPPQYVALPDACSVLSGETLGELAPRAEVDRPAEWESDPGERSADCVWEEPLTGEPGGTLTSHRFDVGLRLLLDEGDENGTVRAEKAFEAEWDAARTGAGRNAGEPLRIEFDPPLPLKGIGDQAFARPIRTDSGFVRRGKAIVTARYRNVVLTTAYTHTVQPADREDDEAVPLGGSKVRAAAETAARETLTTLASCSGCTG